MEEKEMKALVSLLEDEDKKIISRIEENILLLGYTIVPYLEQEWERNLNPAVQQRIEKLLHTLQYEKTKNALKQWYGSDDKDLLTGMWIVSTYQYPDIELEKIKQDIDQIYHRIQPEFQNDLDPFDQIKIINNVFFGGLKFGANSKNFHAPSNSFINTVLETRKGNPITLSVIYMSVAQKLKLPIYGVNFPKLFILMYQTDKQEPFYINVFNRGIIFSKRDIENYISELNLPPQRTFFEPCDNVEIIRRVMRNLIIAFEKLGDYTKADELKVLLIEVLEEI